MERLPELTGAELYVYELEAAEHGTRREYDAACAEIARRTGQAGEDRPARPASLPRAA